MSLPNSFGKLNDTVVEAFADISKGELSTFAMAGSGDAVGDRTVRQHARDQKFLAVQKSHDLFLGKDFCFLANLQTLSDGDSSRSQIVDDTDFRDTRAVLFAIEKVSRRV